MQEWLRSEVPWRGTFVGVPQPELLDAAVLEALDHDMRLTAAGKVVWVSMHVMLDHRRLEHHPQRHTRPGAGPRRG